MKFENGNVLVSKKDCKALRLVMGCNTDLRVKLSSRRVNALYADGGKVVKMMIENHLWFGCSVDFINDILHDNMLLWNLAERMLKGEYDYDYE